jgi:hypothetical protein
MAGETACPTSDGGVQPAFDSGRVKIGSLTDGPMAEADCQSAAHGLARDLAGGVRNATEIARTGSPPDLPGMCVHQAVACSQTIATKCTPQDPKIRRCGTITPVKSGARQLGRKTPVQGLWKSRPGLLDL